MGWRKYLRLPREHGAWAMLYVPFLVGAIVAGRLNWNILFLGVSVTCLFIGREQVLAWWRSRRRGQEDFGARRQMIGYVALSCLSGSMILLRDRLWWLVGLGIVAFILLAVNTVQSGAGRDRTIWSECLSIAGITLAAPAAYYVSRETWDDRAVWLWLLSVLYFTSSVFYVRLRVSTGHPRRQQIRQLMRWRCASYHVFLLVALLALTVTGSLSVFALIAFSPALVRAFWQVLKPSAQVNVRRIGFMELAFSVVFLVFIVLAFPSF